MPSVFLSRGAATRAGSPSARAVGVYWAVIIGLVLMIPILAIVLDSPVGQALANRLARGDRSKDSPDIGARVDELEAEMKYLSESLESLRDETEFVRHLIEGSGAQEPRRLDKGE